MPTISSTAKPVTFDTTRYIKLGAKGEWTEAALAQGELHFGYRRVPHDLAKTRDAERIRRHLLDQGKKPSAATQITRQVLDFYTLGADCLWVTFARGHLWWAFAEPDVIWVDKPEPGVGDRLRIVIGGWRNTDLAGRPLDIARLSTCLTKVSAYRASVCAVPDTDYLAHCINGSVPSEVTAARAARAALVDSLSVAMTRLKWQDFEQLVDLLLSRGGWQRVSALGGSQADTDLIVEQPTTGERAFVQVKSSADPRCWLITSIATTLPAHVSVSSSSAILYRKRSPSRSGPTSQSGRAATLPSACSAPACTTGRSIASRDPRCRFDRTDRRWASRYLSTSGTANVQCLTARAPWQLRASVRKTDAARIRRRSSVDFSPTREGTPAWMERMRTSVAVFATECFSH